MLPLLIVLIFSLFQSFSAQSEFPDLVQKTNIVWNGVTVPKNQLDSRPTVSFNGDIPYLIYCGPMKTGGKDSKCKYNQNYQVPGESGTYLSKFSSFFFLVKYI